MLLKLLILKSYVTFFETHKKFVAIFEKEKLWVWTKFIFKYYFKVHNSAISGARWSNSIFSVIFLVLMFSSWLAMKIRLTSSLQPYFLTQCFKVTSEKQKLKHFKTNTYFFIASKHYKPTKAQKMVDYKISYSNLTQIKYLKYYVKINYPLLLKVVLKLTINSTQ